MVASAEFDDLAEAAAATLMREKVLSSTFEFARFTGQNPAEPGRGRIPWCDAEAELGRYLDKEIRFEDANPRPVKPVCFPRGHHKSTDTCHAMARHILLNPESRNGIVSLSSDLARRNLGAIHKMLLSPRFQSLFPHILFPADKEQRFYYKKDSLLVKRYEESGRMAEVQNGPGDRAFAWLMESAEAVDFFKEPTITAIGLDSYFTGLHFGSGGKCWFDDIVDKKSVASPESRDRDYASTIEICQAICDVGTEIWFTFTPYSPDDIYSRILTGPDAVMRRRVVDGGLHYSAWMFEDDGKTLRPLNPFAYCIAAEEEGKPWVYRGKTYSLPRESLLVKQSTMDSDEWDRQWMCRHPMTENRAFEAEHFAHAIPCTADNLKSWLLENPTAIHPDTLRRGELDIAVVGDPAFGANRWNDRFVLLALAQDGFDDWYVMNAFAERVGPDRLESVCELGVDWAHRYGARVLAMETHAKEALVTVVHSVMDRMRARVQFTSLRGSIGGRGAEGKNERILNHLGPHARARKIHFCTGGDAESSRNVEAFRKLLTQEALDFPNGRHDDCLDGLSFGRQIFTPREGGDGERRAIRKIPILRSFFGLSRN